MKRITMLLFGAALSWSAAAQTSTSKPMNTSSPSTNQIELATLGAGCFWCVEAIFQNLDGVKSVTSGYAGGRGANPTYKQVCSGETGHAEVIQVAFDPGKISYSDLLAAFWDTHDPTTLNRQGADVGTQYRSVIFYHSEAQKQAAEESKRAAQKYFDRPIVTEISPLTQFYKAEDYHQNYFRQNPGQPYCAAVIRPKVEKFLRKRQKP